MECREVREYLPAYAEQSGGPRAAAVDGHLATCAGCRAVLEQYREMAGGLAALEEQPVQPPAWLLGTLTEAVGERARRAAAFRARREQISRPKVAATGGALLAAGIAGTLLLRSRRGRRRRGRLDRVRAALAEV